MCNDILRFWFAEIKPSKWWSKDADFDKMMIDRFSQVHAKAVCCELYLWRGNPQGRLAEIIVIDQFSRNMFRDTPEAFVHDSLALVLAQEAVALGVDQQLSTVERSFVYMPYMHSESLLIHQVAEQLFSAPGLESNLEWEIQHKRILERFGRYPHRNEILGRVSTAEESKFLKQPGSRF